MKSKILKILAELDINILMYFLNQEKCKTIGQLAEKLSKRYVLEDLDHLKSDLEEVYEIDN